MKFKVFCIMSCATLISSTPGLANACSKFEWTSSSDAARGIIQEMNVDFQTNPAVESWRQYVTTFNRKIRNLYANLAPSCLILLAGIQDHVSASLEEMPANERWQDAGILFESHIATVDQVYDNLSQY